MRLLSTTSLLLFLVSIVFAEQQSAVIGQLFEFGLTDDRIERLDLLPNWINVDQDENVIFGVPRWDQYENVTLRTAKGTQLDISVKTEENPCDGKEYTYIEKYYEKDFNSYKVGDLRAEIKKFAETVEIDESTVRAFSYGDLLKYRNESGEPLLTPDTPPTVAQLVLWSRLMCGSDMENAADTLAKAQELKEMGLQMRAGQAIVLVQNVLALQTATPASGMRTTRAILDTAPVLFNKINTFTCKRGILCHQWLPDNTFVDDHEKFKHLNPQVFSNGQHPTFLNITQDQNAFVLEGIGLETGIFNFRLEVRDRSNNVANAPFEVIIEDTPIANHAFEFTLANRIQTYRERPALLAIFARRLANTIGGRPSDVLVESLEPQGQQTLLKFSNNTLSRKSCQSTQINETRSKMVSRGKGRVTPVFAKAMGSEFHVENVGVVMRDACDTTGASSTISIGNFRASTSTLKPQSDEQSGVSNTLLIVLIAVALLVLALIMCLMCFFMRKRSNVYKKANTEYSSKGHPVVFPDEMANHDEEANGATAAVSTPMLVANERPPLQPSATTTTQNPLYKPPSLEGTPTRTAAVGQRLPPPYMSSA